MTEVRMEKVDGLSRRPYLKVGVENNNENQKLIKKKWIREITKVVVERPETILIEKIKRAREKDKKSGRGNIYVPKDEKLRLKVIWLYYNILVARHRRK